MSIQLNTKTNVREDGSTKSYHYINVVFGEFGSENYVFEACGNVEKPQTYEKALNTVKDLLEQELYKRIAETQKKLEYYKQIYLVQELDQNTEDSDTMVEDTDHSEENISRNMVYDLDQDIQVKTTTNMVQEINHKITDTMILELWPLQYRTQDKVDVFRSYEQGMSLEEISKHLKIAPRTLQHWEKKFKQVL